MDFGWTPLSISGNSMEICNFGNVSTVDKAAANAEGTTNTVFVAILTSLLSLLIVVGNGLIIVSVALVKKLRQPANYLIVSLALSDFLVGLVVLPLTIVYDIVGEWVFGPMMCDIHVSFDVICCTASIMNLCMISIDRYLMITKPMTYPKKRTGKLMLLLIATAWIISGLIIIPALFGFTENVKDEPGWIPLKPKAIVQESKPAGIAGANMSAWRNEHSAQYLLDGDRNSYWNPNAGSNLLATRDMYFVLDLGQTYRLSTVAVINSGNVKHDIRQLGIQEYVCKTPGIWETLQKVTLTEGTEERQETALNDLHLKVLRVNITKTYNNSVQPIMREFGVFGEKARGKTCLISQEVWFTIYSTVGAFYLPLCVMLCMYWKIYLEASRFNRRHQLRSANFGGSQEWSGTPLATPDAITAHRSRDTSRIIVGNNNYSMTSRKMLCARISEGYDTNSEENLIAPSSARNTHAGSTDLTVVVTPAFDSDRSDNVFEDDTLSSECDFLSGDKALKRDDASDVTAESDCASRHGATRNEFQFSNGDVVKKVNGYHVAMEASPRARQRAMSASNYDGLSAISLGPTSASMLSSRAESTGNGLDNAGCRYTNTSRSIASEHLGLQYTSQDNGIANGGKSRGGLYVNGSSDLFTGRSRTLYTRTSTLSLAKAQEQSTTQPSTISKPRHSIFSGSSAFCTRPPFRRLSTTPPSTRHGCMKTGVQTGKGGSELPRLSRRRSTVFHQIRRRVSLATSRDRMRNVKATRTLGIIVGAFTFCWLPFFIVTILRPLVCTNPESQNCISLWLVRLVLWLGYLNSALNPVIYIGFSPDLRETFRLLICCKCTNVDRRLAQAELRQAYSRERRESSASRTYTPAESIM